MNALRFSPDGKSLAAGGGEPTRSGDISLWDVASGKLIDEWKERHSDAVLSLDFSPDGNRLASGGADKIARVTDIASGKIVNVFEGHTHHVLGVSFRADGRVLATAGADGVVVIWDMISGERKKKIEGWSKEVTSLQFIGATNQIVTSAGDNLIRIVNDDGAAGPGHGQAARLHAVGGRHGDRRRDHRRRRGRPAPRLGRHKRPGTRRLRGRPERENAVIAVEHLWPSIPLRLSPAQTYVIIIPGLDPSSLAPVPSAVAGSCASG